jgi:cyclophilin family peptidyl-prolyl cis-trans isomerase
MKMRHLLLTGLIVGLVGLCGCEAEKSGSSKATGSSQTKGASNPTKGTPGTIAEGKSAEKKVEDKAVEGRLRAAHASKSDDKEGKRGLASPKAAVTKSVAPSKGAEATQPAATNNPQVVLETSMGAITLELYPAKAPDSVANFLQYVNSGFYAGTIFHRVIGNFMIQGGGFTTAYQKKPTQAPVKNEAKNGLKNDRGTIAMARTGKPHSATSQFFINVKNNDNLNYPSFDKWGYTVFGRVTAGMDVVDKIRNVPTGPAAMFRSNAPKEQVVIKGARVLK